MTFWVAGATVVGSIIGGRGARRAAKTQAASADRAGALQREMYNEQTKFNAPYREAGLTGQNRLMELLGLGTNTGGADFGRYSRDFNMGDFKADPGYSFRLSEGLKGLDRSAAARGGLISGSALKAATAYGQEMGSQEYGNAFSRYQTNRTNQLQPLANLQAVGVNATNAQAAQAGQYGVNAGNLITQGGAAAAAGQLGVANSLAGGISGAASAYQNQTNFNNWLKQANRPTVAPVSPNMGYFP